MDQVRIGSQSVVEGDIMASADQKYSFKVTSEVQSVVVNDIKDYDDLKKKGCGVLGIDLKELAEVTAKLTVNEKNWNDLKMQDATLFFRKRTAEEARLMRTEKYLHELVLRDAKKIKEIKDNINELEKKLEEENFKEALVNALVGLVADENDLQRCCSTIMRAIMSESVIPKFNLKRTSTSQGEVKRVFKGTPTYKVVFGAAKEKTKADDAAINKAIGKVLTAASQQTTTGSLR